MKNKKGKGSREEILVD